jgi:hypothetical protein
LDRDTGEQAGDAGALTRDTGVSARPAGALTGDTEVLEGDCRTPFERVDVSLTGGHCFRTLFLSGELISCSGDVGVVDDVVAEVAAGFIIGKGATLKVGVCSGLNWRCSGTGIGGSTDAAFDFCGTVDIRSDPESDLDAGAVGCFDFGFVTGEEAATKAEVSCGADRRSSEAGFDGGEGAEGAFGFCETVGADGGSGEGGNA